MENMENLVTEQVTENVEQTTEQTPVKTYTQEEVDAIVGKRIARKEAKIRKEYDRKYGELESVLKAGTGKESVEEMTDTFRGFYSQKGIQMPQKPSYTDKDVEVLANADAAEFINGGFEDVVEETERLAAIGVENMSAREKAVFKVLAEHRQSTEKAMELARLGVPESVYTSDDFKAFTAKFASSTPIADIYDIYSRTTPKKQYKTMGSMKSNDSGDTGVKEFYTVEEARRFTKADYDKNPALLAAVERSMQKW